MQAVTLADAALRRRIAPDVDWSCVGGGRGRSAPRTSATARTRAGALRRRVCRTGVSSGAIPGLFFGGGLGHTVVGDLRDEHQGLANLHRSVFGTFNLEDRRFVRTRFGT